MESKARISVLMGIYNCAATLPEALDSLYAQTFRDFQVILCDDGSTDDTYAVAKEYARHHDGIILLRNTRNMGLNYTLNHCLSHADTEYCARMDGDDISLPTRFEQEINFLDQHPEYAVVSTPMIFFDENGEFARGYGGGEPAKEVLNWSVPFCHAPAMIRTEAYRAVGGYTVDRRLLRYEDYHLWAKMFAHGFRGYNLHQPLYAMRDDRNATNRRTFASRMNEIYAHYVVTKMLGLSWAAFAACACASFVKGIMPAWFYEKLHQHRLNRHPAQENTGTCNGGTGEFPPPLISVIVPLYNAERYLGQCLDSIARQTYTNLEIICVNDGSTDGTAQMLHEYGSRDARFRIIDIENSGPSNARNTGLREAKGELVAFVDADDWTDPDTFEHAWRNMSSDADLVCWSYRKEWEDHSAEVRLFGNTGGHEDICALYTRLVGLRGEQLRHPEQLDSLSPVWGKLYKRSIIADQSISFVDTSITGTSEDLLFNAAYFRHARAAVVLPDCMYHYRKDNETSFTRGGRPDLFERWKDMWGILRATIPETQDMDECFHNRVAISSLFLGMHVMALGNSLTLTRRRLRAYLDDPLMSQSLTRLDMSRFPFHWRTFFLLARHRQTLLLMLMLWCVRKLK